VYTLDTNAIIYYQKRDPRVVPVIREIIGNPSTSVYVSTVTEAELFSFPNLTDDERETLNAILQTVSLIPPISQIARITGDIRGTYRLKFADSFIAATALFTGSTLITRNVQDFKKIPHLSVHAI
jgi:predicted nucleic acid-binding protein